MKRELDSMPLEAKKEKSQKLMSDNPGKLPIILKKGKNSKLDLPQALYFLIRYLISSSRTLGELIYSIRKTLSIPKTEGFYLFTSDRLPALSMTILQLYERLSDEDGFLYFTYTTQEDKGNK